jgi:tellurite resistance protein TerC
MIWLWAGFLAFVFVMLALDLFVVNRKAHVVSAREALGFTGVTVLLALAFSGLVYWLYLHDLEGIAKVIRAELTRDGNPPAAALVARTATFQYIAGWLTEYALSLDNIFVIAVIFQFFRVPAMYQHRVLFWGILGALVMRGGMIAAGTTLINTFAWMTYVFGAILLWTAWKMLRAGDEDINPERSWVVRAARRLYPVSADFEGERFFTRVPVPVAGVSAAAIDAGTFGAGAAAAPGAPRTVRAVTPLLLVLLVVETTDVVFAVDSIPAILALTRDPFLVFTSNVFAILGLRSLYFALAALMGKFKYLKASLAFVLAFVGVKMIAHPLVHVSTELSLGVIGAALATGIGASIIADSRRKTPPSPPPPTPAPPPPAR